MKQIEQKKISSLIWPWILVGFLLCLGVFFRFYNLDKKVYWIDEVYTSLWISGYTWNEALKTIANRVVDINDLHKFQFPSDEKGIFSIIQVKSVSNPEHPPLYYLLLKLWLEFFGDSIWVTRSLAVFASLLIFPCIYWLCRELFEPRRVALMAVVLVSVSPFHVLYSQEARQYSLWTVIILLSSGMLLRALSSRTKFLWILYAVTVALGLYIHSLFALVITAHGVYVIGIHLNEVSMKPFHLPRQLISYIIATLAGIMTFVPWLYLIFSNLSSVGRNLLSFNGAENILYLMAMWGFNFSSVFMDAGYSFRYVENFDLGVLISYTIQVLILILAAYSIYFLYSTTIQRIWLFIFSLIVIPFLCLAIPDLLLGETKSGIGSRYLAASYLGIQLAVAYLLATKMGSGFYKQRIFWKVVSSLVILWGVVSCVIISRADTWWTKIGDYYTPRVVRYINNANSPTLIIGNSSQLFTLSYLVNPYVRFLLIDDPDKIQIPHGYKSLFIYRASSLLNEHRLLKDFTLETLDTKGELWRLRESP